MNDKKQKMAAMGLKAGGKLASLSKKALSKTADGLGKVGEKMKSEASQRASDVGGKIRRRSVKTGINLTKKQLFILEGLKSKWGKKSSKKAAAAKKPKKKV